MPLLLKVTDTVAVRPDMRPLGEVAAGALLVLPYLHLVPIVPGEEAVACGSVDVELRPPGGGSVRARGRILDTELPYHVACRVLVLDGISEVRAGTEIHLERPEDAKRWRDDADTSASLNALLGRILEGARVTLPATCDSCRLDSLHIYFHARGSRVGGVWVWCSSCRRFLHGSVHAPPWWRNMDVADEDKLAAIPEYLDGLANAVDVHWNSLRGHLSRP